MSEPVENVNDAVKMDHMNSLSRSFLEPAQDELTNDQRKQLEKLYEIALQFDSNDPVGWINDFNKSQPLHFEVAGADTRLGKVLVMAELYRKNKRQDAERKHGPKSIYRDF